MLKASEHAERTARVRKPFARLLDVGRRLGGGRRL